MDAETFQQKILCHSDTLFRMAKSILRDDAKSQDVFQDTMLKLWEKRDSLGAITNFRAFSLAAIRNQCIDALRKEQDTEEIPASVFSDETNPYQQAESSDTVSNIKNMIAALPELQQTIVRLRDVEEMELYEIAQLLNMTENAVCVNLSRGRKKLREQLTQQQRKEKKQHEQYR